jgi:hypothetical protein
MPQVDLTTLKESELRRLLGAAREAGHAAEAYEILKELAARREAGGRPLFGARRAAEPRVIAVDADDSGEAPAAEPAEEDDIPPLPPGWVPQAPPQAARPAKGKRRAATKPLPPKPQPAARKATTPDDLPPLPAFRPLFEPDPPEPDPLEDLRLEATPPPQPASKSARATSGLVRWSGPIFAVGVALGVAFGWWAGGVTHELMQANPPPALPEAASTPVETAQDEVRPPSRPATHRAAASTSVEPAASPAPSAADFVRDAAATSAETAPAETAEAPRPAAPSSREPVRIARAPPLGCASEPTPADRTICRTPHLQALQRELRRAYAEALIVHQDRALLRQRELAWADARNDVAEPERLARLYDERIRRLRAATAEARRAHGRG